MPMSFTLNDDFSNMTQEIRDPLHTEDSFQIRFNIGAWLATDAIDSASYTAWDELGQDATANVIDAAKSSYTTDALRPWIKGGGTNKKQYTVQMKATATCGESLTFYLKFEVKNLGEI